MDLVAKIRKIECLIVGAKTEGERQAAELAKRRLQEKEKAGQEKVAVPSVEYTVRLRNKWKKKLFVSLCCKHRLKPYRYPRQKHTTAMIRVSKSFMDEVLWPEFHKYDNIFEELVSDIMHDLISKIHDVKEEDEVVIAGELLAPKEAGAL